MKKTQYAESQIVNALKEVGRGKQAVEVYVC